ncbi:nuclear receptor-interacting protein 3 [Rhinatrema bivittatum]|uniref:nuclear receptor-interacting protein 3 n=1 Tax=Rhinatrema bivittatum TaxID=194408 RepID=UPI00112B5692|nr:nuclear receptor-interacting protein 3 [Rhinatrema bivittatum]
MFYSGLLTEGGRKEAQLREAAALRQQQQRRMKQAVQFNHKDSADLLPLDGLKRLGTSKDTQPHNILQRRLLETNLSKLRSNRAVWTPKNEISPQSNKLSPPRTESPKKGEEEELIFVQCQCAGRDMKVMIDTGSRYNLISSACVDRLGLKEHIKDNKNEDKSISLDPPLKVIGQLEHLAVKMGTVKVDCSAMVIEDSENNLSLGLQTLRTMKCVVNLDKNLLTLGRTGREEIPFVADSSAVKEDHSSEA